ncbi:MAG TPA: hypothetical protein VKQ28_13085 [Candidatus Acidoferrum sp.]|nr:hypothetical protein [Candidatus Acidoferrum sp.]
MKTTIKLTAVLMLALTCAFAAVGQQQSLTGIVTDSMCAATHMAKDKTPAECTQMCVKDGMKYALAAGKKVYTLEGHEAELAKLAGQKVTVRGTLKGDTLSVQEVTASK